MTKTHWNRFDSRIESLKQIISGLEISIEELHKNLNEIEWYDGLWLLEESEPIYGIAFISLQNYINSSIYDKCGSLEKKEKKYQIGEKIQKSNRTGIELIIGLANYYKHRDDNRDFHRGTIGILKDFKIKYDETVDFVESPIFKGLDIFSSNWKLNELIEV